MQLYDFPFSPNSRKVRAVAYELDIPLACQQVDLLADEQRAPAFLAKNPNGRVPVLVDGDFVLWESTAIMRYLAAGSALVPTERRALAEMDRWIAWQLAHLGPAMSKVAFENIVKRVTKRGAPDPARIAEGTAEFATLTKILDDALANREYVAGKLGLADFALAAHYSLAEASGLALGGADRVVAWLDRVCARASMQRALADARAAL
ncbi:MAG TPA: glutathione S-transferase family protein [Kofleriaceae bacterium]|nr:glutathione S-transferase family protein [Kofleriaceae bacterium]